MSYERHYYTRPRLIPPAIPISLLLASALYVAGQFVELPTVSRLPTRPSTARPASGGSSVSNATLAPSPARTFDVTTGLRADQQPVQAAYFSGK